MSKSAWRSARWGDLVTFEYGKPAEYVPDGEILVYGANGAFERTDRPLWEGPSVIIGRKGAYRGVHWSPTSAWSVDTGFYVKPKVPIDIRWAYYSLLTVDINGMDSGSAIPSTSRDALNTLPVSVPPLVEQRAISTTLGALDDKIEVNRQIGERLEEIVRTLFRSWFVDFDPVRGTASVPDDIRSLFPDRLVDSRIGPVPEGWEVAPLGDHVEVVRGLSYKGSGLADEGMPLHNLNSIREGGGYKEDGIKHYTGEYRERDRVRPGDLIVANTEQGFDHLLIGYPAIIPTTFGEDGLFSHHLYRLRPSEGSALTPRWLYLLLVGDWMHWSVAGYSNGTTVNMLPKDGIERQVVAVPPSNLIDRFEATVSPMFQQQEALNAESKTLAELRDFMLPPLVAGDLALQKDLVAKGR